jgi:hypothetical protein
MTPAQREYKLLELVLDVMHLSGGIIATPEQCEAMEALNEFVLDHPWVQRTH